MLKRKLAISTLAVGIWIGGSGFANVSTAEAAMNASFGQQENSQKVIITGLQGSQTVTDAWLQQLTKQQDRGDIQGRTTGSTSQFDWQQVQPVGSNLIPQIAYILDVDEQIILDALANGDTLLEIAAEYDFSEDKLVNELVEIQMDAIDAALEADAITEDQAVTMKTALAGRLKNIIENSGVNQTSLNQMSETLTDYFADAGKDYFGDAGIDVTVHLCDDGDGLVYTVTLDFDDAVHTSDLTDLDENEVRSLLKAVKSKITAAVDGTDYEDAEITGKLIASDRTGYYVKS